ncbi:MAG: DNA mismatch repair endonuclease MutL [Dehalococcoidia bacterium]|nr:DNA mismatch repair endonuclease MutL [Dehalococcoidia bacterium]
MPIKVLASDIISRIAAGEVIERPASVVKELVENSLDAGATQIAVEINGGGIHLIRVADNGMGIPADEVELAFERHATGKLTSDADLEIISTLGFRGEALPSIASVSEVSIVTRHQDESIGTITKLERGVTTSKTKQAAPQGTIITVRNLFQNVPARLKFLKSAATETSHTSHLVAQYTLAFPEVKFTLTVNGRTTLRSPGNGNLKDTLIEVYGVETAKSMLEIHPDETSGENTLRVSGFVGPAALARSSRDYLSFFVNRRWIQNRSLTFAVEQAYQGMLMTGKHPIVALNIMLPPQEIDVNVHPTKREIRFRNEGEVFLAVQRAVRETLVGLSPVPRMRAPSHSVHGLSPDPLFSVPKAGARPGPAAFPPTAKQRPDQPALPASELPILRVIGQFQSTYILAEGPDGIYLIDQHAAHERILFEKIREQQICQAPEVQGLLEPLTIEVTARQAELLSSQIDILQEAGFSLEPFGEREYLVRAVPAMVKRHEIAPTLFEIIDSLGQAEPSQWSERIAQSLACHGAVRAGQILSLPEIDELMRQLEQTALPRHCPHGRPTMIHLPTSQLQKEFGRRT